MGAMLVLLIQISGMYGLCRAQQTESDERPIPMGTSISTNPDSPLIFGTAGMLVRSITNPSELFILSTNHVIGAKEPTLCPNTAPIGTLILRTGSLRKNNSQEAVSAATVGSLFDRVKIRFLEGKKNELDAAIAGTNSSLTRAEIKGIGFPKAKIGQATLGMEVIKSGRTTGVTSGIVEALNVTAQVTYGFCGTTTFVGQVMLSNMADKGDSGAVILERGIKKPVALLFAGNKNNILANPFDLVTKTLMVFPVDPEDPNAGPTSLQGLMDELGNTTIDPGLKRLMEIQKEQEESIMNTPGVVAMGIGQATDNTGNVFVVYVEEMTPDIELPGNIQGIPLRIRESGQFTAF